MYLCLSYRLLLISIVAVATVQAQTLTVYHQTSRQPIADVLVYHEDPSFAGNTSGDGTLTIDSFPRRGTYTFQHPAFFRRTLTYAQLQQDRFVVYLQERVQEIDEVVVSANRWEQERAEVSQQMLTVDQSTVERHNPTTSADLLAQSGQVFVQKSQLGGGSPMLRGFAANSVLLVVDGVRLNNAIYRSGNLQNVINIDPNALAGAEVIYGPGAVMYGSDALGGVMDFHTVSPQFSASDTLQCTGSGLLRYGSAAHERTGHLDIGVGGSRLAYWGSVSYSALDDLRAGSRRSAGYRGHFERSFYVATARGEDQLVPNDNRNLQRPSGYGLFNTIHKLQTRWPEAELSYRFYYSTTSDVPRYDRLTETIGRTDSLVYADWYYGPQRWMMHSVQFRTRRPTWLYQQAKATAGYQRYTESRHDRRFGSPTLRSRAEAVDLYTLTLDFDRALGRSNLFYGLDFFHNDVTSTGFQQNVASGERRPTTPRYPDGGSQYYTTALYAHYVGRPYDRWTLNFGGRLSDVRLRARTTDAGASLLLRDELTLTHRQLNGTLGLIFRPSVGTRWSALASSGFRAPNVDDVGKVFEIDDAVIVVPNPGLEPEYSYNQELSWWQRWGVVQWEAVAFHSFLTNAIVRGAFIVNGKSTLLVDGEPKAVRAQVNARRARIYGGSARINVRWHPAWTATGSVVLTEGYELDTGEPLRHVPPVFGQMRVRYQGQALRAECYVDYHLNKGRRDIPSSEIDDKPHLYTDTGTPGWITLNLKGEYAVNDRLSVQLGIENLLDQHYRPYSSGISAPGRNVIVAVRGRWPYQ